MTLQQITAHDIADWGSLDDIASTFEKRGLRSRPKLGEDNEFVLQLADDEFIVLVEAAPGESATDFKPRDVDRRHTNLVATNDFEEFTFITRVRTFGQQHGQIKHQKLSFSKEQFRDESGDKNTILQKLNEIEYGSSAAVYGDLYDTRQIVTEFYQEFETLRTDLVQEVTGIPDDRGDAKQRYVQVTLDRMIFLYFIQEKRLLDRKLDYLHAKHEERVAAGDDVYDAFYHPLFFELLAEGKRDPQFGVLPYLNGGLFSKNLIEEEFPDAKLGESTEQTNSLFGRILDFLSDWNWNVDERLDIVDPKNLSPAVLGHIFEQTVNQKEMGAYYTPEEITGFMARRTIHPYLLDQLNDAVDAAYEEIDEVFGLTQMDGAGEAALTDGGTITQQAPIENVRREHVETLYFDVLREMSVLDPAVGSGAFLLAAQDVLLDVYLQCLEYFQKTERDGMGWQLANRTREELERIEEGKGNKSLYAKRQIILENLYGVDIDDGAVEICKLRLWLSMVADIEDEPREVEPLPNIDFNIRQGNSLIGFTELIEVNEEGDALLSNYGVGESVAEMYEDVIEAVEQHRSAESGAEAAKVRKMAESLIDSHSETLNEKILGQFHDAGLEDVTLPEVEDYSPFHWVLEFATVYEDDDDGESGFDVVIGNPPWDVLRTNRDDYFSKHDEFFRFRMPEEKDDKQEELLEDDKVATGWEEYQEEMQTRADYFNESGEYELQSPTIDGKRNTAENELSALFLERVYKLADEESHVSLILPNVVFTGSSGKDLRLYLLDNTTIDSIIHFENNGIFSDLHKQYRFGILSFNNSDMTEQLRGIFDERDLDVLRNHEERTVQIPREVLQRYSPKAAIFPQISSSHATSSGAERQVEILRKILSHPPLEEEIDGKWQAITHRELDRTYDSDRFVESEEDGAYPVYGGKNIYQFIHDETYFDIASSEFWSVPEDEDGDLSAKKRIREKEVRNLKRALYDAFDGTGSQKSFVNDLLEDTRGKSLAEEDVLLDCTEYRIAFRDIASATNERTLVASVIPPSIVCHNTIRTIRPYKIDSEESHLTEYPLRSIYQRTMTDTELFVFVGLLNSIVFDSLIRTKTDTHILDYKFRESQLPRLTDDDDWFHYISSRAARLNCYSEPFAEMRERLGGIEPATDETERQKLQAEIDAAAFHAYGLDRHEMKFVLDDFHCVSNPRIMTEEYFDLVFEKYDVLAAEGPHL